MAIQRQRCAAAEPVSLTHIEIDVAHTYFNKAFSAESTQMRTGGSLSFSHPIRIKLYRESPESISNPRNGGAPTAHQAVAGSFRLEQGHSVCDLDFDVI